MLYKRLLALISYECHNFTLNFRKEIEEKHECDLTYHDLKEGKTES